MQLYQCHKRVKAAPITEVVMDTVPAELGGYGVVKVVAGDTVVEGHAAAKMCVRYVPKLDDYLVEYDNDKYHSISPKAVFEAGYALVGEISA